MNENPNMAVDPRRAGRLFALEPLGRGGAAVESLTGYIARLSRAHFLPTWLLVMQELVPFFKRKSITDRRGQCDLFSKVGASLNGLAGIAAEAVGLIEFLTRCHPLNNLTLLPLKDAISPRSSIRVRRTWCPTCLQNWALNQEPIRDMLVWQIKAVRVCPFHPMQPLEDKCPHCNRHQSPLARYSLPGFCSVCHGWLGVHQHGTAGVATGNDQSLAEEARLLIEAIGQRSCLPSLSILRNNLVQILNRNFDGSILGFAKAAGLHHSSVADILHGNAKPGLSTLLQLSVAAGVPVVQVVGRRDDLFLALDGRPRCDRFPRKTCQHYDWSTLMQELAQLDQRVSLNRFCRIRGYDSGYVAKRLPIVARQIILKYRNRVANQHETRLNKEESEVRSMVKALTSAGQWPSFRRLKRKLRKPGIMRIPKMVAIRKQMLGLVRGTDPEVKSGR